MAGIRAMGAKLVYSENSTDKYIAHLTSLGAIQLTNNEIDVTDHDSQGKEFIAGDQEADSLSFAGNVASGDDTFERIYSLCGARTELQFEAHYANGAVFQFQGYFANVAMGEQTTDGLMGYTGEIKISGKPTFVPASAS